MLGVALGVVLLPQLSAAQAKNTQAYSDMLDWGLRVLLLLALPCAGADHYSRGAGRGALPLRPVQAQDVAQTTRALMGYGVGLMGLVGVKVLAPGFYARQDIRTPVRIAIVVLATHAHERRARALARPMPAWRCPSAWARCSTRLGC